MRNDPATASSQNPAPPSCQLIDPNQRLVVVSNRVGPFEASAQAGGLAVALGDMLRCTGGVWFGWSGRVAERPITVPTLKRHGNVDLATLDLTPAEHEHYYNGYANSALWPLFHSNLERTCVFRCMPITDSGESRSLIPFQADH